MAVENENEGDGSGYQGEPSSQMSPESSSLIISNVQSLSDTSLLQTGSRRDVDDANYDEGNIQSKSEHESAQTADAYMVHEYHEQNGNGSNGMPHPVSMEMVNLPDEQSRDGNGESKGRSSRGGNARHNTEVGADAMSTTDTEESSRLERLLTEGFSSPPCRGESDSPSKLSTASSVNDPKHMTYSVSRQAKGSTRVSGYKAAEGHSKNMNSNVITTKWGCDHCGIYFTDQVLYFLHSGFHARSNPFQCNSCGHISQNKYEFNTHIYSQKHY
ncbi:DNA-binding protein Ikaros-like [Ptychodera flava]|uniref:DNA-binding protein Ikaros-like n=1 Tax=Ptychodera flava TaxID=63121 RepID=UPI003969F90E